MADGKLKTTKGDAGPPVASHTPNGYDPRWLPPINQALSDRDGDIVLADISDEIWEQFIGPMLDAIERGEVEAPTK